MKTYYLISIFLFSFSFSLLSQDLRNSTTTLSSDSSKSNKRFFQTFQFGNLHGIGIELSYKIIDEIFVNSSLGIKSPIEVLIGPPFTSNRLNLTAGIKVKPLDWVFVDIGAYFGAFKLTEYLWVTTSKFSVGAEYKKFVFEIGAAFNMPTKIYTRSEDNGGTIGMGEERTKPSGPTFPFFKIGYNVSI